MTILYNEEVGSITKFSKYLTNGGGGYFLILIVINPPPSGKKIKP